MIGFLRRQRRMSQLVNPFMEMMGWKWAESGDDNGRPAPWAGQNDNGRVWAASVPHSPRRHRRRKSRRRRRNRRTAGNAAAAATTAAAAAASAPHTYRRRRPS